MEEGGIVSSIALVVALILLHGALQISFSALSNYRRTPTRERAELGDKSAKRLISLSDDLPRLHITTQLTLTFVRFAIVAVAFAQIATPLAAQPEMNPAVVIAAVLIVTALITYIVGDLIAVALGQVYADQLVGIIVMPIRVLKIILAPLVIAFKWLSDQIAKLLGSEALNKAVTEEEIMTLVDESQQSGAIEDDEKEMIYSVLQFGETLVREVMVPRPDITAVSINSALESALKKLLDSGHSRIPVYEDEIDNIRGLLYAKDLLRMYADGGAQGKTLADLMRPAYFVPETKRADVLFKEMQHRKTHVAIVVDEYGGTSGIVTIEDLVEEIVGDIKDEYDATEEDEYVKVDENTYLVDGGMNLDDLNELMDIELPDDENDSVGGYVYSKLGRVPEVGETLEEPGLLIRIEAVENRRIRKVYLSKIAKPDAETEAEETRERSREREDKAAPNDTVEAAIRPAS